MVERLLGMIDSTNDWVGKVNRWLIVVITVVVLAEVVARYIFDHSLIWTFETAKYTYGTYFVLGGAYALLRGAHVNIDVLHQRLPVKVRAIVDVATASFFFFFCGILLWQGWLLFWHSLTVGAASYGVWRVPYAPVQVMIPIACILLLMQGTAKLIRDLRIALATRQGDR